MIVMLILKMMTIMKKQQNNQIRQKRGTEKSFSCCF